MHFFPKPSYLGFSKAQFQLVPCPCSLMEKTKSSPSSFAAGTTDETSQEVGLGSWPGTVWVGWTHFYIFLGQVGYKLSMVQETRISLEAQY